MNQPCLVIMAAGMGSRFGGPKQTTPVDEYGHFLLHYSLLDDEHDLAEARAVGVKERIVQQKMAVLIHGRRLLRASEAAAHTGGHDDQTGLMHTPRSSISQRV